MKNPEGEAFERLKKNKLIDNNLNSTAQGISTPACLEGKKINSRLLNEDILQGYAESSRSYRCRS